MASESHKMKISEALSETAPYKKEAKLTAIISSTTPEIAASSYLYYNRGVSKYAQKKYPQALKDFQLSKTFHPEDLDLIKNLGMTLRALKKFDQALKEFTLFIDLAPGNALGVFHRGITFLYKRDHEKAIRDFSKAIQLNQAFGDAYNNRGWAYYFQKDFEKAEIDFNKALEINPQDQFAQEGLDRILKSPKKKKDLTKAKSQAATNQA